jgi:hypothetical protein
MKTLKYIVGIIVLLGFGNVSYGQLSVSLIAPNPACIGNIVEINGVDMDPGYLRLVQGVTSTDIDLSGDIQGVATTTKITVLLPSTIGISGAVNFKVRKNGTPATTATAGFNISPTPNVTLSVQGGNNTICPGGSATLNFTVSNSGGGSVLINYTKGGIAATTTATGDGIHSVVVSPTVQTTYTIVSAVAGTCTNIISNQSQIINIAAIPTVTLAVQGGNNTICTGGSATLNFTVSNSGGGSVLINYTKGGIAATTTATGDGIHSVAVSPTVQTTYAIVSAVAGTCTNIISNQSQVINIAAIPTVTLAVQGGNNTICPGGSAILNFTVANSGGSNVTINYTVNGTAAATIASGNVVHTVTVFPTAQTIYTIVSAVEGTCTNLISGQSKTIDIADVADVTFSVQGVPGSSSTICAGTSATLIFDVTNTGGNSGTINYTINGAATTPFSFAGDNPYTFAVTPSTTATTTVYNITSITLGSCTKSIQNQSHTITVRPEITGSLSVSDNSVCSGETVNLFFTGNNPNGVPLTFHYFDGTANRVTTTLGTFKQVVSPVLMTQTTFSLDSIMTPSCTQTITNTEVVTVNSTMGVVMASSVASLCQNNNYDLTFAITGSKANDNIQIIYLKDGISTLLNVTIDGVNSNTVITVPIIGQQTHVYNLLSITNTTTGCVTNYAPGPPNILPVTVTPSIIASVSASSTEICNGASTNLIFSVANPDGNPVIISYQDNFGNLFDTTITGNSVVVPFSPSVSTIYTLDSVEINGCTFPFTNAVAITVNKVPTVTVALSGSGIACSGGAPVQLTFTIGNKNSPTDSVMVQYLGQNGLQSFTTTATTYPINVTPLSTTVYSLVSVTNTMVGCMDFDVSSDVGITVTAGNDLKGELQVSRDEVCKGQNVMLNFIINGASGSTDLFYTADGISATTRATGSTHNVLISSLTNTTTFQLTGLTAISTNCPGDTIIGLSTKKVKVNTLPNIVLTTVNGANPVAICNRDSTDLQFNIIGGESPYSVAYIETVSGFNTNFTFNSVGTTPVPVNPTQSSVYNISTIVDNNSCSGTINGTANVTINPLPTGSFTVNDNILCNGQSTTLTFTVANNDNDDVTIQYNEVLPNGITTPKTVTTNNTTTITVMPNLTTIYTITGITNAVTNCVGTPPSGNSKTVTVNELPSVSFAVINNSDTICNGINSTVQFTFSNGTSPFTVFYQDSFSNQTSRSAITSWNNLSFNSISTLPQINNTNAAITHTYFITKVLDGNGCEINYPIAAQPNVLININPTPNVSLIGVKPITEPYASTDASPYLIYGKPGGGNISGAGTGITTFINSDTSQANFIPANAGFLPTDVTRDIILTYSLTDIAGCTGTIIDTARLKKALNYKFYNEGSNTLQTQYCRNSDSLYIFAKIDGVEPLGTNTFVIDGTSDIIFSNVQVQADSVRITLSPQNVTTTGVFLMKFGSTASGFITKQITIVDTINTSFSPFIDSAFFCQDFADSIRLIGIPTLDVNNPLGIFSSPTLGLITADTSNAVNKGWYLQQGLSGQHRIIYTYMDNATGCVTTATQEINITPTPLGHFVPTIDCNNKVATFTDNSTFMFNPNGLDSIITWNWQFGDGADSIRSNDLSFNYTYEASGRFSATLNVVSALGCTNTFDTTVTIGVRPSMNFDWRFETLGEDMELVNLSTANVSGLLLDSINNLTWTFGDGTSPVTTTLNTILHQYANTGVFQIGLTAETDNGCVSDTTFKVFVLPKITTYPYYERFNSSDGEWVADPVVGNVWQWADSLIYNNSNRGWTVDSVGTYPLGSDMFVYSPSFDFTTIEKPMVTFQYLVNSRVSDGGVLQYSLNSGDTWIVLGNLDSGLEWYNVDNLVAQPGEQTGFSGFAWSGNSNTDWSVARHKLDALKGEPKVRFRIAFASVSGGNNTYNGFSFDDFFIGDRQKRVLMENFTNVGLENNYNRIQDTIYQRLNNNDLDVTMVEYHNALPTNDNFNIFNPADPSGRSLYYQFSETGKTVIDGEIYNTVTSNTTNFEWQQLDLDLAILEEPAFNIAIDNLIINNGTLDVTTTIKARKPLNATTRKVYIAVVEDDLGLNNRTHKSTLRKLLPSSAGTSLTNSWSIGTAQTVSQSWTFNPNEVNANKLKVIVWIQDNNTKKVYQSAYSALPNIPFDSTVVNTKNPLGISENNTFNLFPNPNNGNFTIQFNEPITVETNWQLVNINGQIVHQGQIAARQEAVNIATSDLPKGMYFFRLYNEKGVSEVRKVLIH